MLTLKVGRKEGIGVAQWNNDQRPQLLTSRLLMGKTNKQTKIKLLLVLQLSTFLSNILLCDLGEMAEAACVSSCKMELFHPRGHHEDSVRFL